MENRSRIVLATLAAAGALSLSPNAQSFSYRAGGKPFGIHFLGTSGWLAEDGGRIRYSTDSGDTWSQAVVDAAVRDQLRSIHFPTSTVGYAVGDNGAALKSTDGGLTWTKLTAVSTSQALHQVFFHDALDGWIVGDFDTIFHTVDGGSTWISHTILSHIDLYDIDFPDPTDRNTFIVAADFGRFARTTDGGSTFTITQKDVNACPGPDPGAPLPYDLEIWSVDFYDTTRGIAAGGIFQNGGFLFRTTDGGVTWNQENCMEFDCTGIPPAECGQGLTPTFYGAVTTGPDEALTVGYASSLFRRTTSMTPNSRCVPCAPGGGVGWQQTNSLSTNASNPPHNWIANAGGGVAFATGEFGILRKITNSGLTIEEKGTQEWRRIRGGHFVDTQTGYLVGQGLVILKTTDGTDLQLVDGPGPPATPLPFLLDVDGHNSTVVAVGQGGTIRRSGDDGATWTDGTGQSSVDFYGVSISPTGGSMLAVGNGGTVDLSIDQGVTWTNVANLAQNLRGVHMLSDTSAVVVGANKFASYTADGIIWQTLAFADPGVDPELSRVTSDGTRLWAVGEDGAVYLYNWGLLRFERQVHGFPTDSDLLDISLVPGQSDVYAVGEDGFVLHHDGAGWSNPKPYMGDDLVSVDFFLGGSGMIGGLFSGIVNVQ